jgi:hypothetical protein
MTLTLGKGSCAVRVTGPIAETQWRLIADYSRITATAPAMLTANPTSCAAEAGCDRRIRAVMSYTMTLLARLRLASSRVRRTQSRSFTTPDLLVERWIVESNLSEPILLMELLFCSCAEDLSLPTPMSLHEATHG